MDLSSIENLSELESLNDAERDLIFLLRDCDEDELIIEPFGPRQGIPYGEDLLTDFPETECDYDSLIEKGFIEKINRKDIARKFIEENAKYIDHKGNHIEYHSNHQEELNEAFIKAYDREAVIRCGKRGDMRIRLTEEIFQVVRNIYPQL
jgi:hypothetical protein